jgi:hypothetical protein
VGTPNDLTGTGDWANNAVEDLAIETLHKGLTVGLIATKRTDFVTCAEDEALETVVERTRRQRFDYLPVTEHTAGVANTYGRIVGLIEIASLMNGATAAGLIRDWMQRLSDENLIGADASILTFVRDADRQRCRLMVAGHEISGLVSLADLQRLPVRAALFGLITYLEIVMARAIRKEFDSTEGWLERITNGRRRKIRDEIMPTIDILIAVWLKQ